MDRKALISPKFKVIVGNSVITEGIAVECFSSKSSHADWCTVEFNSRFKGLLSFRDMDAAKVYLGYDGDYDILLPGYVKMTNEDYWKKIMIKDEMIKLERTVLKVTFLDCTPQDIIKYTLTSAGIADYKLSDSQYPSSPVFTTNEQNCIDMIRAVNNHWGLKSDFFFQDQIFYWGCKKRQDSIYFLEEGSNILSLKKLSRLWEIETIGIPWIHQSQFISVSHSLYSGEVEIDKTIVKSDDKGFTRMYLYFEEAG